MVKPEDITIKSSTEDIVKPLQDNRGYRGLVLGNDLKILLISDPDVEKAAAALDVNIGECSLVNCSICHIPFFELSRIDETRKLFQPNPGFCF